MDEHYRTLQRRLTIESPRDAAWGERFFHINDPTGMSLVSPSCWRHEREMGDAGFIVSFRKAGEMIEEVCAACHEPIKEEDQWFRLRQEYICNFWCGENFLRKVSERRQEADRLEAKK